MDDDNKTDSYLGKVVETIERTIECSEEFKAFCLKHNLTSSLAKPTRANMTRDITDYIKTHQLSEGRYIKQGPEAEELTTLNGGKPLEKFQDVIGLLNRHVKTVEKAVKPLPVSLEAEANFWLAPEVHTFLQTQLSYHYPKDKMPYWLNDYNAFAKHKTYQLFNALFAELESQYPAMPDCFYCDGFIFACVSVDFDQTAYSRSRDRLSFDISEELWDAYDRIKKNVASNEGE